ncbi:MAG: lactate utilization protein [Verrucomicrobiae bacterium]|nr:lactate utilization protein [Verrucomicrobiae bacterium]
MNSRDAILGRIRAALRAPAPHAPAPALAAELFPPLRADEALPRFAREFAALKGVFHRSPDANDARAWVAGLAARRGFARVAAAPDDLCRDAVSGVPGAQTLEREACGAQLASFDLGVTACDCLVARTGSIVLTAQSGFGRALSVLPPAHLVVARRAQLVGEIREALQLLELRHGKMWPSMATFITGPSRTADIEKILVLGAHGPRELYLLLLDF